jgi:hypothetical protein
VNPAAADATLGTATGIGLRILFFQDHRVQRGRRRAKLEREEIPLATLRRLLRHHPAIHDALCTPITSWHNDIVTPYGTDSTLPLVVLCEPFGETDDAGDACATPLDTEIVIPAVFKMNWEKRRTVEVRFNEAGDDDVVLRARLVDNVTFFASGYIAYSVSFLFEDAATGSVPLSAQILLVLEAIAKPAGDIESTVRFRLGNERAVPLAAFLQARMHALEHPAPGKTTIFTALAAIDDDRKGDLGTQLGGSLRRLFPATSAGSHANDDLDAPFDGKVSIGIEIIGASCHDQVIDYVEKSRLRTAPVDAFSKRLAGIVQNILDFVEQDAEEIHDSLSGGLAIGTDMTFVHKDVAVRFSKQSRAFTEMLDVVGGSPYWMLVQLVLGHNEVALSNLNTDLERHYGQSGMTGMMRSLLEVPTRHYNIREAQNRLTRTLKRRITLSYFIPNLFRYPTEQQLYRLFSQARGIDEQYKHFVMAEDTVEGAVREIATLNKERVDSWITRLLLAIGIFQIAAALIAIAAVGDGDFWYFGEHFYQWGLLGRVLHELGASGSDNAPPPEFRSVWVLDPALVVMALGFLGVGIIVMRWLITWLVGTAPVRSLIGWARRTFP